VLSTHYHHGWVLLWRTMNWRIRKFTRPMKDDARLLVCKHAVLVCLRATSTSCCPTSLNTTRPGSLYLIRRSIWRACRSKCPLSHTPPLASSTTSLIYSSYLQPNIWRSILDLYQHLCRCLTQANQFWQVATAGWNSRRIDHLCVL